MGFDPLTIGLVTGGLSFAQAQQQNSNAKRAGAVEKEQNRIAANEQRAKLAKELAEFQGTLRTTSAARGTSGAASSAALSLSAVSTANDGVRNVNLQQLFGNQSVDARVNASQTSPFFAGFSGGLSGFNTGLNFR